ncbi:MAG: hypothetical protein ACR2IE_02695 [Candidatus Sumerlaeaceae bacterium]
MKSIVAIALVAAGFTFSGSTAEARSIYVVGGGYYPTYHSAPMVYPAYYGRTFVSTPRIYSPWYTTYPYAGYPYSSVVVRY